METYKLTITTCDRFSGSGTNHTVQVKITGETENETKWHTLDHFFATNFKAGATQTYKVKNAGVGAPVILHFRLRVLNPLAVIGLMDGNWMCLMVNVEYNETTYPCPVFDWITKKASSFAVGKATLPQQVSLECVKDMRANVIEKAHETYDWNPKPTSESEIGWGINRYLYVTSKKPLPQLFHTTLGQSRRVLQSGLLSAINAGQALFKGFTGALKTLDDYKKLYSGTGYGDPCFINDWNTDAEMGRQVLTGILPIAIERCSALPENCNITTEDVAESLPSSTTLEGEIEAGKIYIADYTYVEPIKRNKCPKKTDEFVVPNCLGLFHSTSSGDFLPIAIQLIPNDKTSIFTPADTEHDWLLAKMFFRTTQSYIHEWIYHYLLTHGVSEAFSVATFRNFPHCHPLYKLLRPHLRSVCFINDAARNHLIPDSAFSNQALGLSALDTLRHHYKTLDVSHLDIPRLFKEKGLDDPTLLPNYPYRDDALDIWNATRDYVANVVKHFYKSDQDVTGDTELQAWAYDLAHECLGWQDGNTRGMPDKISSISELINICTMAIFASFSQHAAVNFGQMETYQFIPNALPCMVKPVHKKGEAYLDRVMKTLPNTIQATILITLAYALSQYAKDEVFLGDVSEELFVEAEVHDMQKNFKQELNELGRKFSERNETLRHPYTYLLPEKIPMEINI